MAVRTALFRPQQGTDFHIRRFRYNQNPSTRKTGSLLNSMACQNPIFLLHEHCSGRDYGCETMTVKALDTLGVMHDVGFWLKSRHVVVEENDNMGSYTAPVEDYTLSFSILSIDGELDRWDYPGFSAKWDLLNTAYSRVPRWMELSLNPALISFPWLGGQTRDPQDPPTRPMPPPPPPKRRSHLMETWTPVVAVLLVVALLVFIGKGYRVVLVRDDRLASRRRMQRQEKHAHRGDQIDCNLEGDRGESSFV